MKAINNNDLSRYALSVPRGLQMRPFFPIGIGVEVGTGCVVTQKHLSIFFSFACNGRARDADDNESLRMDRRRQGCHQRKKQIFFLIRAFWVTHTGSGPYVLFHFFYWLFLFFEEKKARFPQLSPYFWQKRLSS